MGKMTEDTIAVLFEYGKKVYTGELSLDEASSKVHESNSEVAYSSAKHYISWYSKMREGEYLTWNTNSKLLIYYAGRILEEEGNEIGKNAIESGILFSMHASRNDLEKALRKLAEDHGIIIDELKILEKVKDNNKESDSTDELSENGRFVGDQADREDMSVNKKEVLDSIKDYIYTKGFKYNEGLIENFYLSLKSKPFVILAGTSGTGKTRLVKLFADAINARFQLVPVRPDWSDSSDLFGHVDLNGSFVPGAIINFIKEANDNPETPYFLCLDEMNLARVEYYMSNFLSIIETRDLKDGHITSDPLIDLEIYGADKKAADQYGRIEYPENLYVVGTVNMDETTFPFSRKVLDRANTIEFSYVDLMPDFESTVESGDSLFVSNKFLCTEYLLLNDCADHAEYVLDICERLQQINEILKIANSHVGYRVRDEFVFYLLNNWCDGDPILNEDEAFDNLIMQKILPRLQGSSASVKFMLCELFNVCGNNHDQKTGDSDSEKMKKVLDDISIKCRYRKSAEKLQMMVQRFEEDGFTSYWL